MPHAEFEFPGCHTIGMLLQTYAERDPEVAFVAYSASDGQVTLKVATRSEPVRETLARVCGHIDAALTEVVTELDVALDAGA